MTSQTMSVANVTNDDTWMFFGGSNNNNLQNICGAAFGIDAADSDIAMRLKIVTTIPQGATINSATWRQVGYSTKSAGTFTARVKLEKTANAADITDGANLDGRTYCSDKPALSNISVTDGANYDVDITTAFQELVNFTALTANDYVLVTMEDQGSTGTDREFKSRDNGDFSKLLVDWSVSISAAVVTGTITLTGVAVTIRKSVPVVVGSVIFTSVTPTIPTAISAAVVVGTITLASDTPGTQHFAAISIGSAVFTGVSPTVQHQTAIASGTFTLTGVTPTSVHYAAVSIGAVTLTGVVPGSTHRAAVQVGSTVFTGVTPGSKHSAAVTVGEVSIGFPAVFFGQHPVSVRKDVGVSVGTFTLTSVLPATQHRVGVEVGSVVFTGVTPTADYGLVIAGPFIAVAWANWQPGDVAGMNYQPGIVAAGWYLPGAVAGTNWQPGDVAGDSYQPGDKAGTNL